MLIIFQNVKLDIWFWCNEHKHNCRSKYTRSNKGLIGSFLFNDDVESVLYHWLVSCQNLQLGCLRYSAVDVRNSKCDTGFCTLCIILSCCIVVLEFIGRCWCALYGVSPVVVVFIQPCTCTTGTKHRCGNSRWAVTSFTAPTVKWEQLSKLRKFSWTKWYRHCDNFAWPSTGLYYCFASKNGNLPLYHMT